MGYFDNYLEHHGIKGQKWGVRRFENPDGTLTAAGRARYGDKADKVEKKLSKATSWENKAVNAKTRIGSGFSTMMAGYRRGQADVAASKGEGDFKRLHINKNQSRSWAAVAEANSNIAAKLKEKADQETDIKKREKLMDRAVSNLATAENAETFAKGFKNIADAKGFKKAKVYINECLKEIGGEKYTSVGRKTSFGDRILEAFGNAAIDTATNVAIKSTSDSNDTNVNLNLASSMNLTGKIRDSRYKSKNSAKKRWDNIMNGR